MELSRQFQSCLVNYPLRIATSERVASKRCPGIGHYGDTATDGNKGKAAVIEEFNNALMELHHG